MLNRRKGRIDPLVVVVDTGTGTRKGVAVGGHTVPRKHKTLSKCLVVKLAVGTGIYLDRTRAPNDQRPTNNKEGVKS